MISQAPNLICLGLGGYVIVLFIPNLAFLVIVPMLPVLPVRAAAPTGHDQNSVLVGEIEKVIWLKLSFQTNRIEVHVLDILKLCSQPVRHKTKKHEPQYDSFGRTTSARLL